MRRESAVKKKRQTGSLSIDRYLQLIVIGFNNFLAPVETFRRNMVAAMDFTGGRISCQCGSGQRIVRTTHTAL
tara:strand:+ start:15955 stop:16173 length:219 start_codon:yes stop_codon:yes gene_type:complete